jgi:hypothetical protein
MSVNGDTSFTALAKLSMAIRNTDILENMLKIKPDTKQTIQLFSNKGTFPFSMDKADGKHEKRMSMSVRVMKK